MLVFLFTDIESSTRLWEEHTEEMGEVISRHDTILQQNIGGHGGRIVKHTGDGVFAVFEDGQPVTCALETQKQFASEAWDAIGELRIRAALHAGEAERRGDDYFGPTVNCTARIMATAWGGQTLLTPQVTERSSIPAPATLQDLGLHLLKDVSQPQHIYELTHPELPWQEFPPLRSLSGNAISRTVSQQGPRLVGLTPSAMAVGLTSATLLPTMLGDVSTSSPAVLANLGVLSDLGANTLRDFAADFVRRLRARQEDGELLMELDIRQQLELELLQWWEAGGEIGAALRADTSRLLQAVQGVEAALQAATADVKETLTRGLADLGGRFGEFRWMLDEVAQILAEMRTRQALQLALQREQLDVQCQQLVKTHLLLQFQQERAAAPMLVGPPEAEGEEVPPADVPCPYKGLAAFEAEDAEYFFGREELVAELTARLAGTRFLAVVGPSGSGKSSVVRAGLLPAIWRDGLPGSKEWQTVVLTPGHHPLNELAVRISLLNGFTPVALLRDLEVDHRALDLAVRRVLAEQPHHVRLLLVVDQFEEVFALCRDEGERRQFIDALLYAVEAESSRTVVVPTIRADFYGHCADYPDLASRLQDNLLVGALREDELRQVIERPAELVGLVLEPGLVKIVMDDVADEPGALPLLSHALLETWERRRGRTLTLAGYAESGGVAGAIAQTADSVLKQLSPEQQAIARNVFLRLTELGEEGTQDTRRRVAPSELIPRPEDALTVEGVLKTLADARLITTGEETVEVAHEALIREWPALRGWLGEDREGLRIHRHLTEAAQEWERIGRDPGELYRGARLATASEWAGEHGGELNPLEQEFLAASQAAAEAAEREKEAARQRELAQARALAEEQQRRAETERERAEEQVRSSSRLRRLAVALAAVFLVAVAAAVVARGQQLTAEAERSRAEHEARVATSHELAAAAISNLQVDPERSVLLALHALSTAETLEARNALHQALPELHSVRTIAAHPGGAPGVAYHPDGSRLASTGVDNTVKIWDASSGELLRTLSGDAGDIGFDVAYSQDGKLLAASFTSQVLVWDAASGELRWRLPGKVMGSAQVDRIAFSSDGTRLAVANMGSQPKVWDLASGRELLTLAGHSDHCEAIAFSPDGKRLATGDVAGSVRLWDAATGQTLLTLTHGGNVHGVAFSPDGRQLAAAGEDGRLLVWDTASGQPVLSLPGRTGLYDVAYMPDGKRLLTVHQDGTTVLWDATTGQPLLTLAGHVSTVISVAASPDNVHIATSGFDSTLRLWDTRPGRELITVAAHAGPAYAITYSPDGSRLATAGAGGTAALWDPATGLLALTLFSDTPAAGFSSIVFSPDGQRVAAGGVDGTVLVGDAATGQTLLALAAHTDMVWGLAFSPDGKRLATTSWDRKVRVWNLEDGTEVATLTGHTDMVFGVAFSGDGQRLFSAGDYTGREWDVTTGQELRAFSGEGLGVFGLALSPDGQRLALGRQDGSVIVWDVASGEKLLQLTGHAGLVNGLAFSKDGTRLATASFDKLAKVWDAQTGQELMTLYGNGGNVFGVAFGPDGRHAATAGGDGTARIYTLDMDELTELAHSRVTRSLTNEECQRFLHVEQCPSTP